MSPPVELLGFTVGGARFAAELLQVRRIDGALPALDVGAPLGWPASGHRSLVFAPPGAPERALAVDQVAGVRQVDPGSLRRMPRLAGAPRLVRGVWLDGAEPVLLVDLHAILPPSS